MSSSGFCLAERLPPVDSHGILDAFPHRRHGLTCQSLLLHHGVADPTREHVVTSLAFFCLNRRFRRHTGTVAAIVSKEAYLPAPDLTASHVTFAHHGVHHTPSCLHSSDVFRGSRRLSCSLWNRNAEHFCACALSSLQAPGPSGRTLWFGLGLRRPQHPRALQRKLSRAHLLSSWQTAAMAYRISTSDRK